MTSQELLIFLGFDVILIETADFKLHIFFNRHLLSSLDSSCGLFNQVMKKEAAESCKKKKKKKTLSTIGCPVGINLYHGL